MQPAIEDELVVASGMELQCPYTPKDLPWKVRVYEQCDKVEFQVTIMSQIFL